MRTIILSIIVYTSQLLAQTYIIGHDFNQVHIESQGEYQIVDYRAEINLAALKKAQGQPQLPVYIYPIHLPPGHTLESFSIEEIHERPLQGVYRIKTQQPLWFQDMDPQSLPEEIEDPVTGVYPTEVVEFTGVKYFNGYPIAHFAIHPLRYHWEGGELVFIESITLSIHTRNDDYQPVRPIHPFADENKALLSHIKSGQERTIEALPMSLNDWQVDNYGIPYHYYSAGLVDRYLIITTAGLQEAFKPLADWKTRKGVPTVIRTMDWVRSQFPHGVDDAERLRNYIRWSYQQRGTKFVLLGGDVELVPTRMITTGGFTFPTDYYYADLDGTWNANENDIFGEAADLLDGYPEVYVSRIPVTTPAGVTRFISRLFRYEKMQQIANDNYPGEVLYMAANLTKENDGKELIMNHIDPQINPEFRRTLITQSEHIGSNPQPALDELNKNYAIIFTESHGSYHTVRPGAHGSNIYGYQMQELTNNDPALWYMASCYTNDIAKQAFSKMYMSAENGGGVAYIGNSSYEYPFSGIYLQKDFFNLAFSQNRYHLAEAHFLSRLKYLGYLSWEGPSRIIVYSTIALGDAEMPIWTEMPQRFVVDQEQIHNPQGYFLNVQVSRQKDSSAVEDALVVLYRENEIYALQPTDAFGRAQFDLAGYSAGQLALTITRHNYIPHEQTIEIIEHSRAKLKLLQTVLEESNGNGNQDIEPGESLSLQLMIINLGDETIPPGMIARFSGSEDYIHLDTNQVLIPEALGPDQTHLLDALHLTVDSRIAADTTFLLRADFISNGESYGGLAIPLEVRLPQLLPVGSQIISNPADSTFYETETMVYPDLHNAGRGGTRSLQARISSQQDHLHILDSLIDFGYIAGGQTVRADTPWRFRHALPLDSIRFDLEISDYYGRTWNQVWRFDQPLPPLALSFKPWGSEAIELNWTASPSADISGYHIYRRVRGEESFSRITTEPVGNAGFYVDQPVDNSKYYEYLIQAGNRSGNWSAFSTDTLLAWAALDRYRSFPLSLGGRAVGSELNGLVVYDFNQDGSREIAVSGGHGVLKIINHEGTVIHAFSNLEGFITKPAAANVYGGSSLEVVVSSTSEGDEKNFVYIIDPIHGQLLHSIALSYHVPSTVVLNDLDEDGYDEIIVLTHANNAPQPPYNSRLFIWRSNGTGWETFPGWPDDGYVLEYSFSLGMPASGRLTPGEAPAVIVPSAEGRVYAFQPRHSTTPVWTRELSGYLNTSLSLADINRDGNLEILVVSVNQDRLYVLDHHGQNLDGWQDGKTIDVANPWYRGSPAIAANLDDDGFLEVVYVGRDSVHCFAYDGGKKAAWPIPGGNGKNFFAQQNDIIPVASSPVIADVDQDGIPEIVFFTTNGLIHALRRDNGKPARGFPLNTHNDDGRVQSPYITELDGDNDLEILFVGHDGVLHIWDTRQQFAGKIFLTWSQPYANIRHTGELDTLFLGSPSSMEQDLSAFVPQNYYMKPNYPNPFNPRTTIEFGLKQTARVDLSVYNILGQRVAILVSGTQSAGIHRLSWNSHNQQGSAIASGIYVYRLQVRDVNSDALLYQKQGKMILMK